MIISDVTTAMDYSRIPLPVLPIGGMRPGGRIHPTGIASKEGPPDQIGKFQEN